MSLTTAIERVQQRLASVILIHKSHARWPLPQNSTQLKRDIQISVLDSSFNPPTRAHKALITSANPFSTTSDYDAKLLLLSVRNADKQLKPGDANHVQRLEMMTILAKDLEPNTAVAIIDEPTFIAKSKSLRSFLHDHISNLTSNTNHGITSQLTFLVGFDTLERILAPRYYASEEEMYRALRTFFSQDGDNSRMVCARRPSLADPNSESSTIAAAKEFSDSGRLAFIDIGDTEIISSSNIRRQIATNDIAKWEEATIPTLAQYIVDRHLYDPPQA